MHVGFKCLNGVVMRKHRAWKIIPHTCRSAYERIPIFDSTSEVGLEGELMCIRSVTRIAGEILKGRNASG